jgi:hypothetical protein
VHRAISHDTTGGSVANGARAPYQLVDALLFGIGIRGAYVEAVEQEPSDARALVTRQLQQLGDVFLGSRQGFGVADALDR